MSVKDHYDQHLAHFYAWMLGDFQEKKNTFAAFCQTHGILPVGSKVAIDLGAGHGIQSIALAELGFQVIAIDFNAQLLNELAAHKQQHPIEIIHADIKTIGEYSIRQPELIVCCGDTLPHLATMNEIEQLITDVYHALLPEGLFIVSFRDYAQSLEGTSRFIPVKSDANRILTCFLEFFPEKVSVTDLLYERTNDQWTQKVSSYEKVRVSEEAIRKRLEDSRFEITFREITRGMITLIGKKS